MKEHMRKAYIDILFLFYFKEHWKQLPRDGGGGGGRVVPRDFMPHATCKPQLDVYVGLYSEPSISSLGDTEVQSVPWETHNGATLLRWPRVCDGDLLKITISCRTCESFANIRAQELEICTTKMEIFTRSKPLILMLLFNSSLFPVTSPFSCNFLPPQSLTLAKLCASGPTGINTSLVH